MLPLVAMLKVATETFYITRCIWLLE